MKDKYQFSLLKNDLKRNKAINFTLFFFLFLSALLMATGASVIERLSGSLDQIMDIAQPPHFLQMHVGEIDEEKIASFADQQEEVESFEIQDMANIEGSNIKFIKKDGTKGNFSDSLLDNYFVVQNKKFDYLVDIENNHIVELKSGELGLPVIYGKKYDLNVGDKLIVNVNGLKKEFTISHIVRDAQMGSSLASSIRFLVNEEDFQELYEASENQESIIGFRLYDEGEAMGFQSVYSDESEELPTNGIAITLPLIKLVNGIGDGLMSGVIVLVSIILIVISMLNIRFTLLSTLEEEVREIGTLKAIGLKDRDINQLYGIKYKAMAIIACILAAFISFPVSRSFLGNISLNFGLSEQTLISYLIPFIAVLVVFIIMNLSLKKILNRISRLTIVEALTEGGLSSVKKKKKRAKAQKKLPSLKIKRDNVDLSLSIFEYRQNIKSWRLFKIVFLLASLIILMPLNLWMTMDSPDFIKYMGAANSDIRISVTEAEANESVTGSLDSALSQAEEVETFNKFATYVEKVQEESGKENFMMEYGDYNTFSVETEEGRLPETSGEIAISALNADRLELELGSNLEVEIDDHIENFKVVGIYQDITNGGLTAKIGKSLNSKPEAFTYFINLEDGIDQELFVEKWSSAFPKLKILPVETFIDQTLGTITSSLSTSVIAVFIMAILICSLIAILFISLQLQRKYREDATLLAIGFREKSVRKVYLYKSAIAIVIGTVLGAILSIIIGAPIMGKIFSSMGFGITKLNFIIQPVYFIVVGILAPILVGLILTWLATEKISKIDIMELGNV